MALSLILSLLLFKPAPVYILDEVDAALDLSHTQNIGQMLRSHFRHSQFIVVSLKDGMFNNANVLFKTKFVDGVSTVTRSENKHMYSSGVYIYSSCSCSLAKDYGHRSILYKTGLSVWLNDWGIGSQIYVVQPSIVCIGYDHQVLCNFFGVCRYVNPRVTSAAPHPGEENGMTSGRGKKTPAATLRAKRAKMAEVGSPSVLTPTQ